MPTSKNRGGYFLRFRYVVWLCLLRGQDDDLTLVDCIEGFTAGGSRSIDAGNLTQRFGQNKRCALRQLCTLVDLVKLFPHAVGAVVVQPFISFKLEVILSFLYAPPF